MADTKISAMPNASALTGAEFVPVVQSGANVKTTVGDIFTSLAYAEMYIAAGTASQTTSSTPNTFTKLTCFATNSLSNNCTPDQANDRVTIIQGGVYQVQFYCTFTNSNNKTFSFRLFNESTATAYANTVVKSTTTTTNPLFLAYSAIVAIGSGESIIVQVACATASETIIVSDANISVIQVSPA
jgi:hypothetical protein